MEKYPLTLGKQRCTNPKSKIFLPKAAVLKGQDVAWDAHPWGLLQPWHGPIAPSPVQGPVARPKHCHSDDLTVSFYVLFFPFSTMICILLNYHFFLFFFQKGFLLCSWAERLRSYKNDDNKNIDIFINIWIPAGNVAFQLHQKGSCTDCISEEFLHSLHFFFSFVFFLSYLKKKKEDFLFSSSYCRHSTATLALETQARRLGGQCHPSFNILLSTKKKTTQKWKTTPQKNLRYDKSSWQEISSFRPNSASWLFIQQMGKNQKNQKKVNYISFSTLNSSTTTHISGHHHAVPLEDPSSSAPHIPVSMGMLPAYPSMHLSAQDGFLTSGWRRCKGGAWAGRAHQAAGHVQRLSHPPRSTCCGCPGQLVSTAQRAPRGPGTPARVTDPSVLGAHSGDQATPPCAHPITLTSVDVTVRTLSRSSTNCLKVGRCEGTACQHSRMIIYLYEKAKGTITHGGAKWHPITPKSLERTAMANATSAMETLVRGQLGRRGERFCGAMFLVTDQLVCVHALKAEPVLKWHARAAPPTTTYQTRAGTLCSSVVIGWAEMSRDG